MKTILEIFYVRIVGKSVHYQRKLLDLSKKDSDPDARIWSHIQQKHAGEAGDMQEQEFIVHSTSWRYKQPGRVLLTYVAYSDGLEFPRGKFHSIALKNLPTITKKSSKPPSKAEEQRKVVSHAMRHIAFLIQSGDQENFRDALAPETVEVFKKLWISLAGKVF